MKKLFCFLAALSSLAALGDGWRQSPVVHDMPLEGVVNYHRPGDIYFFLKATDGTGVWRVEVADPRELDMVEIGAMACVTNAEIRANSTTRRLLKAHLAPAKREAPFALSYKPVKVADLYRHPLNDPNAEDLLGELVSCEGVVRDINRRQTFTQIQVGDGNLSFQASARIDIDTHLPEDLKLGAKVRIKGIMLYSSVDDRSRHVMTDFTDVSVMPLGIDDVEVLSAAPFWTPAKIWVMTGASVLLAFILLAWAAVLKRSLSDSIRKRIRDEVAFEATHRERLRLSSDLHDSFQQLLAGTEFRIGAAQNMLEQNDIAGAAEQLARASSSLNYTQTQLRTVLWGLNEESEGPASLAGLFKYAAERMAHWKGIVEISSTGKEPKLARMVSGALLMVLQEAVGNALLHGFATHVDVKIDFTGSVLVLTIADNGVGFDVGKQVESGHYGLDTMRNRVEHLGGKLSIESTIGEGTTVAASIPLGGNGQ